MIMDTIMQVFKALFHSVLSIVFLLILFAFDLQDTGADTFMNRKKPVLKTGFHPFLKQISFSPSLHLLILASGWRNLAMKQQ